MRRIAIPMVLVAGSIFLYPATDGLFSRWKQLPSGSPATSDEIRPRIVDSLRGRWTSAMGRDTGRIQAEVVPDPFRSAVRSQDAAPKVHHGVEAGPPPPRLWKATGRVGERAAVLSHPDGRVQVVSVGQILDSASVLGIGPGGVELEDRGGRFTLRIP